MNSSQASARSYSRIQTALGQLMRDPLELFIAMEKPSPLLVLETPNDSVGFVLVNGKPRDEFDAAYSAFKRLYREKRSSWKDRSISFVVCRSEAKESHDEDYLSGLEMDAYFCRKYLVRVPTTDDELARELLRLPFVPLIQTGQSAIERPAAAQSLLQIRGVSAQLARQIVVPNTLSAARLIEQSLDSPDVLPPLRPAPNARNALPPASPATRTRLKQLVIESFRVYKQKQVFNLDADIIVLFGPNGLGKTSFFDALDYVCTGRIGRLRRRKADPEYFRKITKHLGSSSSEGSVTLEVRRGESTCRVSRDVADWGTAIVEGRPKDRTEVLQFLTSAQWGDSKARIENLERLFRATHLFSQAGPELLVGFDETSTLSTDIVARTLALDDYTAGLAKCSDVLESLRRQDDDLEAHLKEIARELQEAHRQVQALSSATQSLQVGEKLTQLTEELMRDLRSEAGINARGGDVSSDAVREWRALVDSILRETRGRVTALRKLEDGFARHEKDRTDLQQAVETKTAIGAKLAKYDEDRRAHDAALRRATTRLSESKSMLEEAKLKHRQISECLDIQTVSDATEATLHQWRQELSRTENQTLSATADLQHGVAIAEALRSEIDRMREASRLGSQRIVKLESIRDDVPASETWKAEITRLQQREARSRSVLQETQESLVRLEDTIAVQLAKLSENQREYAGLAENQSELMKLLDEIEAHVSDGTCPACGVDHQSKENLLERIRAQKAARPEHTESLATANRELRKYLQEAEGNREALVRRRNETATDLKAALGDLATQRANIAEFSRRLEALGIPENALGVNESIAAQLKTESDAAVTRAASLLQLEKQMVDASTRIAELRRMTSALDQNRGRTKEAIRTLEVQLAQQHSKAGALGLSLDVERSELERVLSEWASKAREFQDANDRLLDEYRALSSATANADAQRQEMKAQVSMCDASTRELERKLREYEDVAISAVGTRQVSSALLAERRSEILDRENLLDRLSRRTIILEGALDAAQRTAMGAKLDSDLSQLTKRKADISAKRRDVEKVKSWFSQVKELLSNENETAVEKHVRAFGPLTTMIQKRLRPVFGFGDVQIVPKGNEIAVDVTWESKSVKPTDFFSDSQKQILMLSLFLSGRLTQTWSSFAPILLDDPVTHFDDLNAFSFVELIRGLVCESNGERQFIISTCEERLFELMRRKFAGLQGGAKFYKFLHVNDSGPAIEEVTPSAI